MTTVLALGTFDLFHAGHVRFLEQARALGDELTVAVNTDEFAARFKRAPVVPYRDRAAVLRACRHVDRVISNYGDEDARGAILYGLADIVVHGDDWTGESYKQQLGVTDEWLADHNVRIEYVPYTAGISTSGVISRILRRSYEQREAEKVL